jgi:hypothetical protein
MSLIFRLCICLVCFELLLPLSANFTSADNEPLFNWSMLLEKNGSAQVTVAITGGQGGVVVFVPKTYQNLQTHPPLNCTPLPFSGISYDEVEIESGSTDQLNLSYVWPDAAVQYNGAFYFAGQEKPNVSNSTMIVILPDDSRVSWIEGYENFPGNITKELTFIANSPQAIPSFAYTFPNMPQIAMESKASTHVNLTYYAIMDGEPWIEKTLEIVQNQWDWMKSTLKGTINQVNVTFAPYGYNDLGTKFGGFCYYNTRNIEIVATNQFGIGDDGWTTATLFHELTHALTPLLEAFPSFYSEALAQDFSYDALRRTELNASADQCEEYQFTNAFEYGVKGGLLHYIYDWKWGDEIDDNATISNACYGTVTFVGDYFAHRWGYEYYYKLIDVFNNTEIASLPDVQKLSKFLEYMSLACAYNVTQIMDTMPYMITRWSDAYNLRNEFLNYKLTSNGPFTESAQGTIDSMIKNATQEYDARNFESAITGFNQVKAYVDGLKSQDASYWREQTATWQRIVVLVIAAFAALILLVIWSYRRKLRRITTRNARPCTKAGQTAIPRASLVQFLALSPCHQLGSRTFRFRKNRM